MKLLSMRALRLIAMSAALWHSLLHLQLVEGAVATPQTEKPADQANIDALQKLAQQESESGQTSEAIRDYKRVLASRPEWKEGWWNLGVLQYGANQFVDAKSTLRHVVAFAPDLGVAWSLVGLSVFETRNFDNALLLLEQARSLG